MIAAAEVRRAAGFAAGGVVLAVATGPEGRRGAPGYAVSQSLHPGHLFTWVGVALALWAAFFAWRLLRARFAAPIRAARTGLRGGWDQPAVRYGVYLGLLLFAIAIPSIWTSPYWQTVLVNSVGVYALLAIGLNIVVGFAGLLDLGYIAFYAIGAYITAYFTGHLPVQPPFLLSPFLVIPFAIGGAMLAGLVLGAPTLRLRGDYLAIVTLGFGEIITIFAVNLDGSRIFHVTDWTLPNITNGSRGAFGIPHFGIHVLGINYDWTLANPPYYYLLLGFIVVILWLFHLLENSRVGRAWIAIREDEVAAQACGIAPVKYKLMAFAIGASTSGFAGVLFASKIGFINTSSFQVSASILVLVLVIVGGMGSLPGSIVGAVAVQLGIGYIQKNTGVNFFGQNIPIEPQDIYIYVGALLIIMMIFRPQGLVPSRRRAREIGLAEHGVGGADAMGAPAGGVHG